MAGLDLDQLQAELELKRSALADSILSKLPGLGEPSSSAEPSVQHQTSTRLRHANLGVGATPKGADVAPNGRARSAADLRLKGALTAKRKRWQDEEPNRRGADDESDGEEVSRAQAIGAKMKAKQDAPAVSEGKKGKVGKKDPFAAKGIEVQRLQQNQPRIVVVDGEEIDLSKLSKTQRKKINKKLKAQNSSTGPTHKDAVEVTEQSTVKAVEPVRPQPVLIHTKNTTAAASSAASDVNKPAALTALQAQMLSKLSGSRFRTINEKLYTTASTEAVSMIDASPAMFDEYHQGFREQVRGWPKNPLDRIADLFDSSHSASSPAKGKGKGKNQSAAMSASGIVKARFTPGVLVVDLGAGEGGLAKKLVPKGIKVLCYDLVTTRDGWVRKQDTAAIGGLPLPGYFDEQDPLGLQSPPSDAAPGVADVAVFCLSLMGTNWIHMILEAKRVLRAGGELIIAEVSSRFDGFDKFISVVKNVGFSLESKDTSNTHFVLFEFVKLDRQKQLASVAKMGQAEVTVDPESATLDTLAEYGKTLLKPCIYKRR